MSHDLALLVTRPDGTVKRWGPDEISGADIPSGLTWDTTIPGGFKQLSCALLRDYTINYADQALFDDIKVIGDGTKTLFEGRMRAFPAERGETRRITPAAIGWVAHLLDDPSFREIYVDRDLTRWRGPGIQRRINLVTGNYSPSDPSVQPDDSGGAPSLAQEFRGPWAANAFPEPEAIYDAQGISIGSLYYAWKKNTNVGTAVPWVWNANLMDDDIWSSFDTTGALTAAGPGSNTLSASTSRSLAGLFFSYQAAGGTDNTLYGLYWTCLAVYGRHGLTKRGANTATSAQGFYGSDMIADIVRRAAPLLTFTTGPGGSIEPVTFVIEQMAFLDETNASDAISLINGYHLYEWGVYDDREFFWRAPDPERCTWRARLDRGAQISYEGDDADNVYNGVVVVFTDPAGKRQRVGPPGLTGAASTSALLVDSSPDNPINAHGIPRRWAKVEMSYPTTPTAAIQIGAVFLRERGQASRRGRITLKGTITHPTMGERPVAEVRAGDYILLADRPDDPPRRIINTNYNHDTLTLSADLDNTVFRVEAIMERMGLALVGQI